MSSNLSGSTALITGATSGIGRATAEALAALGAHVIVTGRDTARGEQAVADIRAAGGKADFIAADLTDAVSARALAEQAESVTGKVDILVNNAGVYSFGPTGDFTERDYDRMYDINVKVPYFLVSALAPKMAARGTGSIVNVSTALSTRGVVGASIYSSTKAALNNLTQAWAAEFGPSGVRVNTVSPGPIHTAGTAALGEGTIDTFAVGSPVPRVGEPHEVAGAIAFLVSPANPYVQAAYLTVDGGVSAV